MSKNIESIFTFDNYEVESIKFTRNCDFKFVEPLEIDFSLKVNTGIIKDNTKGKVTLILEIFKEPIKNNYPFSLDLIVTGYFSTKEELEEDRLQEFLEINGTAALFPFLRSIVCDITKNANIEPLIIPLINIYSLIEEERSKKPDHGESSVPRR